ncbi:hypothetical protein [Paenibacillus gansuensis]|uniref:Uncharacterized protein n=1 Tax=Paenibacillus gansuensis TaxID=306542 RepID=A0ABW5P9F7_9BACL
MVLVYSFLVAWFSLMLVICAPKKLPVITNVLAYLILSILDINKLALLAYYWEKVKINTGLAEFWSVILFRNGTFTLALIAFINVWLTAQRSSVRWGYAIFTYAFIMFSCQLLHWFDALSYNSFGVWFDYTCLLLLLILSVWIGKLCVYLVKKGGYGSGEYRI